MLLGSMPVATTLVCESSAGALFHITTSRAAYEQARADGWPVFAGGELSAMAAAARNDRAWAPQLAEWLTRKATEPAWRLTMADALAGWVPPHEPDARGFITVPDAWTIGQVFRRLGVTLVGVHLEG